MILIRPETPKDYSDVKEINDQAFNQENEGKLVEAIRETPNYIPELSLVAIENGQIAGHILFSIIHIETETGPVPVLGLAPMAVRPEFQKQGIGSELVKAGLKACAYLGHKVVVVLGHPNFYTKFGFTTARLKGVLAPFTVPDDAFMVCELTEDALQGVSGIVRYPAVFDDV